MIGLLLFLECDQALLVQCSQNVERRAAVKAGRLRNSAGSQRLLRMMQRLKNPYGSDNGSDRLSARSRRGAV
jgi:hypothetical protein